MVSQSSSSTRALNQNLDKSLQIAKYCALFANEKKAEDISVLSVAKLTSYADYFVICTATSERHAQALARNLIDSVKKEVDVSPLGVEGLLEGNWVLLDFGDVLCHIFTQEARGYYDLDGLWADAKNLSESGDVKHSKKGAFESCES